jgi:hypothetical protein
MPDRPRVRTVRLAGPPGVATSQTIAGMVKLVRESLTEPDVREQAHSIVRGCDGRDYGCQFRSLRAWLARVWRFRRDPWGVEWVTAPLRQLAYIRASGTMRGDCDDAAVLGAALGMALGFAARFVLLGFEPSPKVWAHVYTELLVPGLGWQDVDVTRPRDYRRPPARIAWVTI